MKILFVIAVIILANGSLIAQHSTIAPVVGNVLTKGIPNYVTVGLPGIDADSIIVTAHHSRIEKIDNWSWYITPDTGYATETVIVTALRKKKIVSVDSTVFRLKWTPDPRAYIFGKTGTSDTLPKSLIENAIGLTAYATGAQEDLLFQVVWFAMILDSTVYLSNSAFITPLQKSAIHSAKPGDRIMFAGIKVKYPDGRIKEVEKISFVLK